MGTRGDVDAYYNKAYGLVDQGKFSEAIEAIDTALRIHPDDTKSWALRGIALSALEKHQEAIEAYDHVLSRCPEDADTLVKKAMALFSLDSLPETIALCDRVLLIDPDQYLATLYRDMATEKSG